MIRRPLIAVPIAALALSLAAATALAGGWAEVRPDASTTTEPSEGDTIVLGFTVLQHSVTPAGWVSPTVHLVDLNSGATHDVRAIQQGADGHFQATTPPLTAGYWTWSVSFPELESDELVNIVAVRGLDGTLPSFAATDAILAVDMATKAVRQDLSETFYRDLDAIRADLDLRRAYDDRLTAQMAAITEERDALAAQLADGGMALTPALLAGVLLLAVLAGGLTAFAIVGLAGRQAPREIAVSPEPTPRGSSPA